MTDVGACVSMSAMRAFLISSALAALLAATSAAANEPLVPVEPEQASEPSMLVPLAGDSLWTARFAAAADTLLPALRSLDERQWAPLLGGQWLAASDRARVAALLRDRDSPFHQALFAQGLTRRVILGWQPPATLTADDRAAIAARPEAEAIICWASGGTAESQAWPRTAAEADNATGRPYACARISYSVRAETPSWRAFIERG